MTIQHEFRDKTNALIEQYANELTCKQLGYELIYNATMVMLSLAPSELVAVEAVLEVVTQAVREYRKQTEVNNDD